MQGLPSDIFTPLPFFNLGLDFGPSDVLQHFLKANGQSLTGEVTSGGLGILSVLLEKTMSRLFFSSIAWYLKWNWA